MGKGRALWVEAKRMLRVAGVVLCGGQSSRMGRPKAWLPFAGELMLPRVVRLLAEARVPGVGGYLQPRAAVYRVEVAAVAERLLAEGRPRPAFLFDAVPTRFVSSEELADVDPSLQSLRNLNTPAEYEAALREAADAGET